MLTALLDALINFIGVLAGWLVDVALVLEATPFSFAWPLLLALLLQALLAALSGVVWWARGAVWPINCGYPETTTGRGPCHNDVLGEWSRCRIHRRRGWFRRTDSHVIVDLRRWQTIDHDGRVVERDDAGGSGFLRQHSDRIGLLYYRGWARPPKDVARLLPVVIEDYRYRLAQLRASWRPPPRGLRRSRATSVALDDVIVASQLIAGLLLIGLAFIGAAGLMNSRAPHYETTRAILEYAAVFLYFAVVTFKHGIVGRRQGSGKVVPVPDWMQRSWMEAGSTFGVMILLALASVFVVVVVYPVALVALRSMSGPGCASGHHEPRAGNGRRAASEVVALRRRHSDPRPWGPQSGSLGDRLMPMRDRCGTDRARRFTGRVRCMTGVAPRQCRLVWGLRAEGRCSRWAHAPVLGMLRSSGMALKKQPTPKRWRSKEAKEIVAAVQRAGGQVERTASGHLKVIGPVGSAIVASAPNTGRAGGRAVHNTLATIRSKTGLQV